MKFIKYFFYKTALIMAVENENNEMVRLLLQCQYLDVNLLAI